MYALVEGPREVGCELGEGVADEAEATGCGLGQMGTVEAFVRLHACCEGFSRGCVGYGGGVGHFFALDCLVR